MRKKYFNTRIEKVIIFSGMRKLEIATTDTRIIIILPTSPAAVAACPRIKPPTVVAVGPMALGSRRLASVRNSIIRSMISTSTKEG
ncbi:hypothetical protein D3C81_2147620 [compost metagenome]